MENIGKSDFFFSKKNIAKLKIGNKSSAFYKGFPSQTNRKFNKQTNNKHVSQPLKERAVPWRYPSIIAYCSLSKKLVSGLLKIASRVGWPTSGCLGAGWGRWCGEGEAGGREMVTRGQTWKKKAPRRKRRKKKRKTMIFWGKAGEENSMCVGGRWVEWGSEMNDAEKKV